jgi:hypothetical protein
MADREGNSSDAGQLANGPYQGPGCNGRFESYERFFKFVHPKAQWSWQEDRPATSLFRDDRESVNWEALATPESTVAGRQGFGVVSVNTGLCVRLGQKIEYTPVKNDPKTPDNPAHCDVVGRKGRTVARKFAVCAKRWIRP